MTQARFVGGVWDGKVKYVDVGAACWVVPVPVERPGDIDELLRVELDATGMPIPRPLELKTHTYRRRVVRDEHGNLVEFVYELESKP